jgi:hypothetical protein
MSRDNFTFDGLSPFHRGNIKMERRPMVIGGGAFVAPISGRLVTRKGDN